MKKAGFRQLPAAQPPFHSAAAFLFKFARFVESRRGGWQSASPCKGRAVGVPGQNPSTGALLKELRGQIAVWHPRLPLRPGKIVAG